MSLLVLLLLATGGDALTQCRQLDQRFDTKGMQAPCSAAVDDAASSAADRAEAARLLAVALFANGSSEGAEEAFLRMLALAPDAKLPEGTSPRLAETFANARARFQADGQVALSAAASARDHRLRFDANVGDPFGRAVALRGLLLLGEEVVRDVTLTSDTAGHWMGSGPMPAAADGCRVEAMDANGNIVASGTCESPTDGDETPWLWIGVGAGAAVVAVGVGALLWATAPQTPASVTVRIE